MAYDSVVLLPYIYTKLCADDLFRQCRNELIRLRKNCQGADSNLRHLPLPDVQTSEEGDTVRHCL